MRRRYWNLISKIPYAALASFVIYDGMQEFPVCGASVRFLRSLRIASVIAVDYFMLERRKNDEDYELQLKELHGKSAYRLLQGCLQNGGLYIKVGQGMAAINHILPREYTRTLALLQDECLPTSRSDVQKLFREDFGQLPEEIYAEFSYEPVAAASLAQVFRAKLKTGEEVAVKVQYSDLQKRFTSDLGTIIFLQDIIELFFKNYNFGWILRDLRNNLVQEMDFLNEAKNAEKCAVDLKKFNYLHVPKIHWDFTKSRVLTMEWIDGIKISEVDQIKSQKMDLRDIDVKLFELFAEQIFNSGFIHADPHPGNIFLRKNPKSGKADIILLDHGLYENLPLSYRLPLCEFWEATVLRDEVKMKKAAEELGIHHHMKFAEVLFQQPIQIHGGQVKTKLTDSDVEYMQKVAKENFDRIMDTLKEMPPNMLFVVRNLNTIRAIGRQHGDLVDRPRIMARYAQRCIYSQYNSFVGHFRWLYRRALFEYYLWRSSVRMYVLDLYFNLLYKIGRAPESAKTILRDLTVQEIS